MWTDGRTDDAKTISLRLRRGIIILSKALRLNWRPGLEVIKLDDSLKHKIKRNDWLLEGPGYISMGG